MGFEYTDRVNSSGKSQRRKSSVSSDMFKKPRKSILSQEKEGDYDDRQ